MNIIRQFRFWLFLLYFWPGCSVPPSWALFPREFWVCLATTLLIAFFATIGDASKTFSLNLRSCTLVFWLGLQFNTSVLKFLPGRFYVVATSSISFTDSFFPFRWIAHSASIIFQCFVLPSRRLSGCWDASRLTSYGWVRVTVRLFWTIVRASFDHIVLDCIVSAYCTHLREIPCFLWRYCLSFWVRSRKTFFFFFEFSLDIFLLLLDYV